jgi:polyvinyl alcohol dehydrogenase (cytochrome)
MVGPDFDFSASPILLTAPDGRQIIAATQKSGLAYGLDPASDGDLLWTYRWGRGSGIGGVWGAASDGAHVYLAVADVGSDQAGGVHAVDPLAGAPLWFAPPAELLCEPGPGCSSVQSAAVTAIPGAVLSGGVDGGMRAYDAQTGEVIWTFDANREFDTVNGVAGRGGSFDGPGPVVADGMVFMTSGNGGFVGRPGNVLLAFEVAED